MEPLYLTLFSLTLLFCLAASAHLIRIRRRQGQEQQRLQALTRRIQEALAAPEGKAAAQEEPAFPHLLRDAASNTVFQKPRLRAQAGYRGGAPEKYRYFATLREKGMAVEEIAEILAISKAEASQLASLAMVAGKRAA